MSKSSLLKNARNYAEYLRKKERGPVKTFFHITKNENVPAIEQQGLLTNHPNANINSANHPFRKHGTDAGGVWVTTEPTAFPVYGTTIGGKNGNAAARADALSTIKIEVPLPELRKMKAVQDPYGKNILRKGDDLRAVEKFGTWAGIDVPTTVLLNDVKPQWLKNIGYVEENAPSYRPIDTDYFPLDMEGSWRLDKGNPLRGLDKSRLRDYSGLTGHHHNNPQDAAKSPYRFVDDYIAKNEPITKRLPTFPKPNHLEYAARYQGADNGPKYIKDGMADVPAPNEANRYSVDFIPARKWTEDYRDYVKPGESVENRRQFEFAPGAISRGIGGANMPPVKERDFNWNRYKKLIERGKSPQIATNMAKPDVILDWNNIIYRNGQYVPEVKSFEDVYAPAGAISRGLQSWPSLKGRNFNWNKYNKLIAAGHTPQSAAKLASPASVLDLDNLHTGTRMGPTSLERLAEGSISRGNSVTDANRMRTEQLVRRSNADRLRNAIKPFTDSNADIVRNEYKFTMPDDEIRELARLEMRNNKDNRQFSDAVRNWSHLENSDILKLRQRALDKIEGSWLYDYLTK